MPVIDVDRCWGHFGLHFESNVGSEMCYFQAMLLLLINGCGFESILTNVEVYFGCVSEHVRGIP